MSGDIHYFLHWVPGFGGSPRHWYGPRDPWPPTPWYGFQGSVPSPPNAMGLRKCIPNYLCTKTKNSWKNHKQLDRKMCTLICFFHGLSFDRLTNKQQLNEPQQTIFMLRCSNIGLGVGFGVKVSPLNIPPTQAVSTHVVVFPWASWAYFSFLFVLLVLGAERWVFKLSQFWPGRSFWGESFSFENVPPKRWAPTL